MSRVILFWLPLLAACAPDADPAGGPGGDDTSAAATDDVCADAPVTTWDNFGAGFMTQHCKACHATTTTERNGAPEEVALDTEEDVWMWADRIVVRSVGDDADMPPQGGVDADDRYLLEVWLTCGG